MTSRDIISLMSYSHMLAIQLKKKKKKKKARKWGKKCFLVIFGSFFFPKILVELPARIASSPLEYLHQSLASSGVSLSTGCHAPETAKLFVDTCSAELYPQPNWLEHTVQ